MEIREQQEQSPPPNTHTLQDWLWQNDQIWFLVYPSLAPHFSHLHTSTAYIKLSMPISVSCMGKERGGGIGWKPGWRKLTKCYVHVSSYHSELHYDVRLQCTNKSTSKKEDRTYLWFGEFRMKHRS